MEKIGRKEAISFDEQAPQNAEDCERFVQRKAHQYLVSMVPTSLLSQLCGESYPQFEP